MFQSLPQPFYCLFYLYSDFIWIIVSTGSMIPSDDSKKVGGCLVIKSSRDFRDLIQQSYLMNIIKEYSHSLELYSTGRFTTQRITAVQ